MAGSSGNVLARRILWGTALAGLGALAGVSAFAEDSNTTTTALDEITVTAERGATSLRNASATVSVKKAADMQRKLVKRPRDLIADEPGVTISQSPTRTGAANYNIRGISANRVKLLIDGVTIPDYPSVLAGSQPSTYTRDVVDFDNLKQVDIVKGPASALYGSDAIGGVVGFVTKDPDDYLNVFNKDWYIGSKVAYDSIDKSIATTETAAARSGGWSAMFSGTGRWGHEIRPNTGTAQSSYTTTTINPQYVFQSDALGKVVYRSQNGGEFKLTLERFNRRVESDLQSDLSSSILSSLATDNTVRNRVGFDFSQKLDTSFADEIKGKVYYSGIERTDTTNQLRYSASAPYYGTYKQWRKDTFKQNIFGTDVQLNRKFDAFGLNHELIYGTTLEYTTTERLSEGTRTTSSGTVLTTFGGDTYPHKKFPDTKTTTVGLYAQDTMKYNAWRFIPALRLDYWNLSPQVDSLFLASGQTGASSQHALALSPKFGTTYDLNDTWRLIGQYSHGFRAPPYDNVNYGFTNTAAFYKILPNYNLKPETSNGLEGGLRGKFADGSSIQLTGYYNIYDNFLDLQYVGTSGGYAQYQYVNLDKVTIFGAEARGEWRMRDTLTSYASLAYAHGRDSAGYAIDSVNPLTAIIGAKWQPLEQWTLESRIKGVAAKTDVSTSGMVKTAGYMVADAFATYEPSKNLSLNFGVLNLFDRSYIDPADVASLQASGQALERYRAAGRSYAVSLSVRF